MTGNDFVKRLFRWLIPEFTLLIIGRVGRCYVRRAPWVYGKFSVVAGRYSPFRLCDVCRLTTVARTEFGSLHNIRFPDAIQRSIFYFGVWEPAITAFVKGSLSPGDTFVDIGANVGYYACLASKLVGPSGQVHAIEASPIIFRQLNDNLDLNAASNVRTYNAAVLDRRTTVGVYQPRGWEWNTGATSVVRHSAGMHVEAHVDALPLDKIVKPHDLFGARLIKIDVEGAEWFVVQGLKELLRRFSPETEWLIEITPTDVTENGGSVAELIGVFASAGYQMYTIENYYCERWYIERRHQILLKRPANLLRQPPENICDQMDVLFTKKPYDGVFA